MDMTTKSDDTLAYKILDMMVPAIMTKHITKCIIYHDPDVNSPEEVMVFTECEWVSVDWISCKIARRFRGSAYSQYIKWICNDSVTAARIRSLFLDLTRVRRDLNHMLDIMKKNSQCIIDARQDPAGDLVAIDIRKMFKEGLNKK